MKNSDRRIGEFFRSIAFPIACAAVVAGGFWVCQGRCSPCEAVEELTWPNGVIANTNDWPRHAGWPFISYSKVSNYEWAVYLRGALANLSVLTLSSWSAFIIADRTRKAQTRILTLRHLFVLTAFVCIVASCYRVADEFPVKALSFGLVVSRSHHGLDVRLFAWLGMFCIVAVIALAVTDRLIQLFSGTRRNHELTKAA